MSTHWYYILVNLCCFIVPFLFSFHPKLLFYRQWKAFLLGIIVMMAVFIPWDMFFTAQGIWGFNTMYTSGIFIGNLPLEEWLFFICIPYACTFTYHCIKVLINQVPAAQFLRALVWVVAISCLIIAALYYDRWYTFIAHVLCGLFLFAHLLVFKSSYLNRFMLVFLIIFAPFIISNGILTGIDFWNYEFINTNPAAIGEKIVWYNNSHNLGLRLFTMPADDIAYGLSMLLLTVTIFEKFTKTKNLPK